MNDRFTRFYTLTRNDYLHENGCPATCIGGALLLDKQERRIVGQLKFRNLSKSNIISLKVSIKAYDDNNQETEQIEEYTYRNINVPSGEEFGGNRAIVFSNSHTRRMTVEIHEVIFDTAKVWLKNKDTRNPLPIVKTAAPIVRTSENRSVSRAKTTSNQTAPPKKTKRIPKIAVVLIAIFAVLGIGLMLPDYGDAETFQWTDIELNNILPIPDSLFGKIMSNSEDYLSLYVYKTEEADYETYIEKCIEFGYTVDEETSGYSYDAYNANGYHMSLYYDDSNEKMHINVEESETYGEILWPETGIAQLLPVPVSVAGEITLDDETGFHAYVSGTPIESFRDYITSCTGAGFTVEPSEQERSYSAENEEGYRLHVEYKRNNVIYIQLDEPMYDISIAVKCEENWIFSKYDVNVYLEDSLKGSVAHGTDEEFAVTLTKGTYELKFVSADNEELTGTVTLNITDDAELEYQITCGLFGINVDTIAGTEESEDAIQSDTLEMPDRSTPTEETVDDHEALVELPVILPTETEDLAEAITVSEYELAFVRELSNYSLYYMFDTDSNAIAQFGTDDTYLYKGTYTGDFSSGVIMTWDHGEWTDKFIYSGYASKATYIDGNGFDWEYESCDLKNAQKILDQREEKYKGIYNSETNSETTPVLTKEPDPVKESEITEETIPAVPPTPSDSYTEPSHGGSGWNTGSGNSGNSVTIPTYEDTEGNLVWVPVKGGTKYHSRASCSNMEDPMQVTVDHATANGYTPCKRCYG